MITEYVKKTLPVGAMGLLLFSALAAYAQNREKKEYHPQYFSSSTRIILTDRGFFVMREGKGTSTARAYENPLRGYALKVEPHRDRAEVTVKTRESSRTSTYNYDKAAKSAGDWLSMKWKNLKDKGIVFR
jgi:hypothetical protein